MFYLSAIESNGTARFWDGNGFTTENYPHGCEDPSVKLEINGQYESVPKPAKSEADKAAEAIAQAAEDMLKSKAATTPKAEEKK